MRTVMAATVCESIGSQQVRQCSRYNRWRPIDEYRLRNKSKDLRHTDCRRCHVQEMVDLRERRRARAMNQFASDVHHFRHCSVERIAAIVERMICKFGGIARFADAWKAYIDECRRIGRPHVALRHVICLLELSATYSCPQSPSELSRMTDEELQQDLERNLVAMLVRYGEQHDDARKMAERVIAAMG